MTREAEVSVICLVYNHEKYLRQCLDGFVSQETNFKYEVIVHDDCSTDHSVEIIKEYQEKYPEIIKPVFETKNQFSQGLSFIADLIRAPKSRYIAFCEGDDYWCSSDKLQKQYDFMESHDDYSMCVHNTIIHDLSGQAPDTLFFDTFKEDYRNLDEKEVFDAWMVHYSSYFIRNSFDLYPDWGLDYFSGDYVLLAVAYMNGKIGLLPDVMSVYDYQNPTGVTTQNANDNTIQKVRERRDFLEKFLKHFETDEKERTVIEKRMAGIAECYESVMLCTNCAKKKTESLSDEEKYEWLKKELNTEAIRNWCMNPTDSMENRVVSIPLNLFVSVIEDFVNGLTQLQSTIHFSYVPWLIRYLKGEVQSEEYLLAVSAHPENTVGWGHAFRDSSANRKEMALLLSQNALNEENKGRELQLLKQNAMACFEQNDTEECLKNIKNGLEISSLDPDLILYKAFLLSSIGKANEALDEIGIYSLFYGLDSDIEDIYKLALSNIVHG